MIRVRASSRLHFGVFSLPAEPGIPAAWPDHEGLPTISARRFGGVGLMVERPGLEIAARPAAKWSAHGPLADRALEYAQRLAQALYLHQAQRITVEAAPPAHVGLGTGTQLALAVARAVTLVAGQPEHDAMALARLVGRGQRSALGIHGFAQGGFLVEAGKRSAEAVAPLVARMPFPTDWSVVLIVPHDLRGDHGPREADAFRALAAPGTQLPQTEALCRLVLLGMLPALVERDLDGFGEALYDFNRRVGELFQPWQGGLYSHPRTASLIEAIRSTGLARGVGQSSWGPSVFAVTAGAAAPALRNWLVERRACAAGEISVTAPSNHGAAVELAAAGLATANPGS